MRAARTDAAGADRVIAVYKRHRPRASNLDIYLILSTDASNFRTGTDAPGRAQGGGRAARCSGIYFQWYSPVRGGMLRSMHTAWTVPVSSCENLRGIAASAGHGRTSSRWPIGWRAPGSPSPGEGKPNHAAHPELAGLPTRDRATMVFNNDTTVVNNPYGEEKKVAAAVTPRGPAPATR